MDVGGETLRTKPNTPRLLCFALIMLSVLLSIPAEAAQNLLINSDFSEGSDNHPTGWTSESWLDLPGTTFTWISPFSGEPGELEISNDKLNDSRWVQSATLSPGLYSASAEIFTQGVPPQSWAGALVSVGDQSVASMDVKGNSNWTQREVFFTVSRPHTKVDVKLRLAGFKNFAVGQAFFRNAVLVKMDRAPEGAMVLDLDADNRLWAGNPWTLVPIFLLLGVALVVGWRLLGVPRKNRVT
jgi:hypothetical protein